MNVEDVGMWALVSAREASRRLGISVRKLFDLTKSREVVAVRIGRAVRYDPRDLMAYADRQKGV